MYNTSNEIGIVVSKQHECFSYTYDTFLDRCIFR